MKLSHITHLAVLCIASAFILTSCQTAKELADTAKQAQTKVADTIKEHSAPEITQIENPYYQEGDTTWDHGDIEEYYYNQLPSKYNEVYRELYSRLKNNEDTAELYAQVTADDFWIAYYAVLDDHPELYWMGDSAQITQDSKSGIVLSYQITSTIDVEDRAATTAALEAAADVCISQIPEGASTYEQIKFTYEYLINTVDYDLESPDNQNIQSALLNQRSVCAGYSRAFQYILHRMGLFCTYITGTTTDGTTHSWNVVRMDDQYYNVDVTWGDATFVNSYEGTTTSYSMNYNYLCCTDEDLYQTHVADIKVALPSCTDNSYDYYRLNGMYYDTYDQGTIYNALMNSVWSGASSIAMKFGSVEAYEAARTDLFTNNLINDATQYLMSENGVGTWNSQYHADDTFHLITIYWQ